MVFSSYFATSGTIHSNMLVTEEGFLQIWMTSSPASSNIRLNVSSLLSIPDTMIIICISTDVSSRLAPTDGSMMSLIKSLLYPGFMALTI